MRQLFPSPVDPVDPADVYGDPPRAGPGGRPGVRLNMIASVDGATTVAGVSGGLGGGADHELFALLRSLADVVLVAAGTVRAEGYGPSRVPVAVVTRSCRLDWESPFFTAPVARPIVVTVAAPRPTPWAAAATGPSWPRAARPSTPSWPAPACWTSSASASPPARSAATPSASWTASRSPARPPCACARSASRTGSCSCATARGRVVRLPAWTH
jgi:RibD C-terminal domain